MISRLLVRRPSASPHTAGKPPRPSSSTVLVENSCEEKQATEKALRAPVREQGLALTEQRARGRRGPASVGLPWPSLLAFLRISTNPRAFRSPLSMTAAWEQVASWLSAEAAWSPEPAVLSKLLALPGMYGNLVPDAHLAALAIEHGLTLCSTDGDFARFRG